MIRRNNRLFKSRKKSQKHRSNFLKNRRNLQKQMRQARWDHINGIITQEGDKARKEFWRYVKQFKKDNTGITEEVQQVHNRRLRCSILLRVHRRRHRKSTTAEQTVPKSKYPECVCNWSGEATAEPKCK